MIKLVTILLALTITIAQSSAGVIFETNFDSNADWEPQPVGKSNDASPSGGEVYCNEGDCSASAPTNWSYFRATGLWYPPTYKNTIKITNQTGRGGSGKAFIVYNESNSGASGDGWGADGQLSRLLGSEYNELYIRFYTYYQPGWAWDNDNDMSIKTFRVDHYDGSGSVYQNFSGGNNGPMYIYNFKHSNTYGTRALLSYRCTPIATNYSCGTSTPGGYDYDVYFLTGQGATPDPNSTGEPADGSWHRIDIQVKMNTFTDDTPNADGIARYWYDGVLISEKTNVKWLLDPATKNYGWNLFSLGGNAMNNYRNITAPNAATGVGDEQWYAIDDVVISTEPIPEGYSIGGTRYQFRIQE